MNANLPSLRHNMAVTVDIVVLTVADERLKVLLVKRRNAPYAGVRALPGGFLQPDESPDVAAARVLARKAGLDGVYLEQLYTFDRHGRDPRGHVLSIAYVALVPATLLPAITGDALEDPAWSDARYLPETAFDHQDIVAYAIRRIAAKLTYTNIVYSLLPETFTLTQVQNIYERILGQQLDKRNFRRKFLALDLVDPATGKEAGAANRPAQLYRFRTATLTELERSL